jgi:hypothetical protein
MPINFYRTVQVLLSFYQLSAMDKKWQGVKIKKNSKHLSAGEKDLKKIFDFSTKHFDVLILDSILICSPAIMELFNVSVNVCTM